MNYNSERFSTGIASCLDTEAIDFLLNLILGLPGDPAGGRKGGFFSVYNIKLKSMVTKSFGDFPEEKTGQYFRNSTEKVSRLVKTNEWRSFESWNKEKEYWGGGIRYGATVCAFSGFPEKIDEALSLVYAIHIEHLHLKQHKRSGFFYDFPWADQYPLKNIFKDNEFIETIAHEFNHGYNKLLPE